MGLDIWFRDDVRRILLALAAAGNLHGPEYHQALADVAIAFGVDLSQPPGPNVPASQAGTTYDLPREGWVRGK